MKNVLILAAGNISNKLSFIKAYYASPALIPINTKPLILYHLEFYRNYDCKVYLVVNQKDSAHIEESVNLKEFDYEIIEVPNSHGVNASLHYALAQVPPADETVVNLVTSIPIQFCDDQTIVLEKQLSYNNDWSCINQDADRIEFLFKSNPTKKLGHAFTGVFSMATDVLTQAVDQVIHRSDLMEIFAYLNQVGNNVSTLMNFVYDDWIDAGHEINYYQSKLKLISSRSFNSVSVNEMGILKKQSTNYEKLKSEVEFITAIPPRLSILFPRIVNGFLYDSEKKSGSYAMEFYGYPSIAELQLFWDLKDEVWTRIFLDIETVINLFVKQGYSIGKQAYLDFYVGKISDRVNGFYHQLDDQFKYIVTDDLTINGIAYESFDKIKDRLYNRIEQLYSEDDFCVVHGDFCFNNVLYDVPHRLIKLIDPRGSFGNKYKGLYGDVKYDLAKLLHSAVGGYDYLVNNLYKITFDEEKVDYHIFYKQNNTIIANKAQQLVANVGYSIKDIMLIVGTLFLTMPPLHADSSSRQRAMYIHGIKFINENL
jgi:NDP-sugar pyrophosphorylase family protein